MFDKVLALEPDNIQALKEKGSILIKLVKYEESLRSFDKLLSINPYNEEAKNKKAFLTENLKKKKYTEIISKIETIFNQQKDYNRIITLCDEAIIIDKEKYIPYLFKAKSLQYLSKNEEAVDYYDKVLSIDPNNEEAKRNKEIVEQIIKKDKILSSIKSNYENKDYEKVLSLIEDLSQIDPDDLFVYLYKGHALYKLHTYQDAIKCYDKVLEIQPSNDDAKSNRILASYALKIEKFKSIINSIESQFTKRNYSDVIYLCDTAINLDPNNYLPYRYKGNSLHELGNYNEAITCYEKALVINPDDSQLWNDKGLTLFRLARYQDAIKCYDKVLSIEPYNNDAKRNKEIVEENLAVLI